jgi:small-conductance mechanosensitive channel
MAIRRLFHQTDRKRLHQVRVMAGVAVQVAALVLILLVLFGPPSQVSTIIGLATAGLTVVLRDFIVSFFGWFALMGKNGIRVGDARSPSQTALRWKAISSTSRRRASGFGMNWK